MPCRLLMKVFHATLLSGLAFNVFAQCEVPEFDQFDFWIGTWEVTVPDGRVAGHNTIEEDLGNCLIHEHYTTPSGYEGHSLNTWDSTTGRWHQTWVDNGGLLLQLDGELVDGSMVMSGPGVDGQGEAIVNRITWTPADDGSVRQLWESRPAEGGEWQVLFDGHYTLQQDPE